MKNLLAIGLALSIATSATAGNLAYVAPEAVAIEEPAAMGGSGAWLIPLVIIAVVGLAMSVDNGCNRPGQNQSKKC